MRIALFTFLILLAVPLVRAQLVITNSTMFTIWSDSYARAQFGQRQNFFILSHYINKYPQFLIDPRDHSRSGGSNLEMDTNRFPKYGVPEWGSTHGKTNVVDILYVSANAAPSSNTVFGLFGDMFQAPGHTYNTNGLLTNDWSQSTALYQKVVFGDIPYRSVNGDTSSRDRSYGGRNQAIANGAPFVDTFVNLSNTVVSSFLSPVTTNAYWFNAPALDHPGNELDLCWALTSLTYPTNAGGLGEDTNIYTALIDFGNAATTSTNHCTITGLSKTGNVLTFTFHADRSAPGFYVPDGVQTNDCRGAFTLMPALGNAFCEIWRFSNLPPGSYNLVIDGSNCVTTTDIQLAAGFNFFTNYTGAFWAQKKEGLGLLCDIVDVVRADASTDAHPGDNRLIEKFESYANTVRPTNQGGVDSYIAQADMAAREQELQAEDILIHANAQQTNHTVSICYIAPVFAGGHR